MLLRFTEVLGLVGAIAYVLVPMSVAATAVGVGMTVRRRIWLAAPLLAITCVGLSIAFQRAVALSLAGQFG